MEGSAKKRRICRNEGIAGGPSGTHTSTEGHKMVTPSGYDYEVFLSFRGPNTGSDFTDFLYTSLNDAGIHTFRDDEELRVGEEFSPELLQAINQSKILIPIFSKGYASNAWCLKELVRMVECHKTGRQKIMPIFYDVAPSEVRHQTGGFGDALLVHENKKRYGEETINEWKAALSVVGNISGWDLHCQSPRREGQFAKKLTEEVFRELKKGYLAVSDYLVNVDKHVDAIMEMIGAQTSETRILGIHGMGGIGKTTIAKVVYNKLSHNFANCCSLLDIREMSKSNGIQFLQSQLISSILKTERMDIKNIDEGTQIIKYKLSNKRVLLILDDVEEMNHIDAFVGKRDWLGNGSKIIVTTRNKYVLNVPEVDCSYELPFMNHDQSLQLFSKHAFRRDSPLEDYIVQSNRAIGIAGGLPLALEVIGSLLCCTRKEMWDARLKKLESSSDYKVLSKLKISYDALDLQQQRIFLDIACNFIGHNKGMLVHFWDESKFFLEEAMIVLENMSLIKINEDNTVWMHNQLRNLGREIVCQKSDKKIEKQSRVWDPKVGLDLLRRHKGKTKVEALCLKLDDQQQYCFTCEDFENLSYLRFLKVDGSMDNFCAEERLLWHESPPNVAPTSKNSYLLPQLRWLSWKNIPPTFNITNFSMEEVVILDLSNSKIMDDWNGWSHMEVMKNLKFLNLSECRNLRRLPDMLASNFVNLEYLSLRECTSLEMLPDTLGNLKSLIELDISETSIQELPDSIGKLKNLKVVKMRLCGIRKMPPAFWMIENLKSLDLSNCRNLRRLPDSLGNLKSLVELDISNTSIEELPDSIGKLKNLKVVVMQESGMRKIPRAFWTIEKLEEIEVCKRVSSTKEFHVRIGDDIYRNQSLRILRLTGVSIDVLPPRLPESLIELQLGTLHMDIFPDLSNLNNLKELDLLFSYDSNYDPDGFVEDPMPRWIGNLSKLESLSLEFHCETASPTDISLPPRLKSLRLSCPNLRCLPKLPSSLSSLQLDGCSSLCSMEDVSNLKNLSSLSILGAAITEVGGLGCLENLQDLSLCSLKQVQRLPDLSNLNILRRLQVGDCDDLVEIQGELPRCLSSLRISSCPCLRNLPDLSSLVGKEWVEISGCGELNAEAILGFARKSPRALNLVGFNQLHILPDLSESNELSSLVVSSCQNLVEIEGELPQSLEELEISSCKSLQKLPVLSNLKKLRSIKIRGCGKLNVEAILVEVQADVQESLEKLDISFCEALYKLPDLSGLMGLREVCISSCANLVKIQGELPESLEILNISLCESLLKLPDLSCLKKLQRVDIGDCTNLEAEAILGSSRRSQANLWENLQYLRICGLGQLEILLDLSNSIKLRHLQVEKCCNLVEIQGKLPESLKELKISSCKSLQKLPDLLSLKGLQKLKINRCGKLNVEVKSLLCSEKLVKFVVENRESESTLNVNLREKMRNKCTFS